MRKKKSTIPPAASAAGGDGTVQPDLPAKEPEVKFPAEEPKPEAKPDRKPLPRFEDTGPQVPPFLEYFDRHIQDIKTIQSFMETKLSADPAALAVQLTEAEKFNTKARSMLAWANSYLDLAERQRLVPYDRGSYTDTDRGVELAAACARERRFRDVVEGLVEGIERRVSLGQSLLRYHENQLRQGA